jgi:hypothetical protein
MVNEAVKIFTRRGHDWTKRFRKVADDAWHIGRLGHHRLGTLFPLLTARRIFLSFRTS